MGLMNAREFMPGDVRMHRVCPGPAFRVIAWKGNFDAGLRGNVRACRRKSLRPVVDRSTQAIGELVLLPKAFSTLLIYYLRCQLSRRVANEKLLREVTGHTVDALKISEKPDNLQGIIQAVRTAVSR
jgi:hypothetical protein